MRLVANVGGEGDVLADGEVGEEDGTLRGVSEVAAIGRDAVEGLWLGQGLGELHVGRGDETAGGAEDGALAAAGRTKEDGPGRG